MSNVVPYPGSQSAGGSGPEDPMLEKRVEALEIQSKRIEDALQRIEVRLAESAKQSDLQKVQVDVAEMKGRISTFPTAPQLILWILTTWGVGAGLVFTVVRFSKP